MAITPSPWQPSQRPPFTLNEKRPGPESARLRFGQHRKQLADEGEQPGVGCRIRSRRASDRRLIDLDDFVDVLDALDAVVRAGLVAGAIQLAGERSIEDVVHERGFARTADAGDGDKGSERNAHVDVLQVVLTRTADDEIAFRLTRTPPLAGVPIVFSPRRYCPVSES